MKNLSASSVLFSCAWFMIVLLGVFLVGCELDEAGTPTAVRPAPPLIGQATAVIQPTVPLTASPAPATDTPTVTALSATATATNTAVPPTGTATASPLPASSTPTVMFTAVPIVTAETATTVTAESRQIITSFTLTPTRAARGGTITVSWESEGIWAEICTTVNQTYPERYSCEEVAPSGSKVVLVEPDATIYYFQLEANNGELADFRGVYGCIDVSDWFLENPPDRCASAPPVHTYAAAQRFEHGLMVWLEASGEFIVFYQNNTFTIFYPPLEFKPNASVDNRVGGAPDGYFEPVSGFGLIWRGEVERSENIRAILGWALEPEFGFDTTYQSGILSNWHFLDRYMRDPEGRIIYFSSHAYVGSRWRYWEN